MELTSTTIPEGGTIPLAHCGTRCGGHNVSPSLAWTGAPSATSSFALLCIDPDAPIEGGWWHWAVHDIPADCVHLPEGGPLPVAAREWRNDYGAFRWDGPCPPPGPAHHYVFTLHALDVPTLRLPTDWPKERARELVLSHSLATATLTGTFGRRPR